jgi:hypothetical protein
VIVSTWGREGAQLQEISVVGQFLDTAAILFAVGSTNSAEPAVSPSPMKFDTHGFFDCSDPGYSNADCPLWTAISKSDLLWKAD